MSSETWKLEKDLCRCCHAEGSFTSLAERSYNLVQAEIFSEMLRRCFDIDICPVEGTYNTSTYTICEPCISRLRDASNFKQQVLLCEERFRKMFSNVKALIGVDVKLEEQYTIEIELKEEYIESCEDDACAVDDGHDEDDNKTNLQLPLEDKKSRGKVKPKPKAKKAVTKKPIRIKKPKVEKKDDVLEKDAPLPKQPKLETNDDETDQVEPQKETEGPKEITSNVDSNKKHRKKICYVCGKHLYTSNYSKHLRIHTGEKPFSCSLCEFRCSLKANLRRHVLLMHTEEKLYSCYLCEQKFIHEIYLKRHLKNHSGEKPYSCSYCEYRCSQKSHLKSHLRQHTDEKPFSCSFCEYQCRHKPSLTRHMQSHVSGEPCSLRENKLSEATKLKSDKPYSCSQCGYKCTKKLSLDKHLRIHTDEVS